METQTPPLTERCATLMEELRPPPGSGPLVMLIWEVFKAIISLLTALAARAAQQQACQPAVDGGADRPRCLDGARLRVIRGRSAAPAECADPGLRASALHPGYGAVAGRTDSLDRAAAGADCIEPARCARRVEYHTRVPSPFWRMEAGIYGPDSKNSAGAAAWNRADFVTISQRWLIPAVPGGESGDRPPQNPVDNCGSGSNGRNLTAASHL